MSMINADENFEKLGLTQIPVPLQSVHAKVEMGVDNKWLIHFIN